MTMTTFTVDITDFPSALPCPLLDQIEKPLAKYCIPVPAKYQVAVGGGGSGGTVGKRQVQLPVSPPPSPGRRPSATSTPSAVAVAAAIATSTTTSISAAAMNTDNSTTVNSATTNTTATATTTTTTTEDDFHRSAEYLKLQTKFTSSCFKWCAYTTLFVLGVACLLGDNYIYAMQHGLSSVTDGWFFRQSYSFNYEQWPRIKMHDILVGSGSSSSWWPWSSWSSTLGQAMRPWVPSFVRTLYQAGAIPFGALGGDAEEAAPWLVADSPILYHYAFALAHYLYATGLIVLDLDGPKQSDKVEMTAHHVITMFLVGFSWYWKLFRVGAVVLVLHDISDPLMEVAKLMLYSQRQWWANLWFASFAGSFLISRWLLYPVIILVPAL